jgi:hypothetical protein
VPRGEIADIERNEAEAIDLHALTFGQEPIGNSSLIENFDGACLQPTGPRSVEFLRGPALNDCDVNAGKGEFAGEHQPCWTSTRYDDRVLRHVRAPL